MNKRPVYLTILLIYFLGFTLFSSISGASESPPDEVVINLISDLYQPVSFDHLMHSEIYDCNRCHHASDNAEDNGNCTTCHSGRPIGGKSPCSSCHSPNSYEASQDSASIARAQYHIDTPALKATWHLLCRNCHVADDGPTDCQDCHGFTIKGKEFFQVKN
ncbi:MAG: hypothetical protein ACI8ZB_005269 [Desulforhopalus sp.]|jgi:hypothetical protein